MAQLERLIHFAVTIIGKDRPGIVAGTAEALYSLGCNIEDSSCTMLAGEFAMILIVSHEMPFSNERLMNGFASLCTEMGLSVSARTLLADEIRYTPPKGELCIVSVYGSDRPGIVYRVTKELADRSVNITDLNTKLIGTVEQPVYVLILEAALPEGVTIYELEEILSKLKNELNVEISIRSVTPITL